MLYRSPNQEKNGCNRNGFDTGSEDGSDADCKGDLSIFSSLFEIMLLGEWSQGYPYIHRLQPDCIGSSRYQAPTPASTDVQPTPNTAGNYQILLKYTRGCNLVVRFLHEKKRSENYRSYPILPYCLNLTPKIVRKKFGTSKLQLRYIYCSSFHKYFFSKINLILDYVTTHPAVPQPQIYDNKRVVSLIVLVILALVVVSCSLYCFISRRQSCLSKPRHGKSKG